MYNSNNLTGFLLQYAKLQKGEDLVNKTKYSNISHDDLVKHLEEMIAWNFELDFEYQDHIHNLLTYIPPVLLTMGTIGNFLAFIVLVRFVGNFSTYHYLYTLALMDTVVLLSGLLNVWSRELKGTSLNEQHGVLCKLLTFLGYFSSDVSVWLLIAVTVERMILLRSPLFTSTICTRRRTKVFILGALVLSAVINSHLFFTVELQVTNLTQGSSFTQCEPALEYKSIVNDLWPWIDAMIYSFAPFIIISIANILSLKSVIGSCKIKSSIPLRQVRRLRKKYKKLTIMIFVLSLSFLCLTLPMNVMMILAAFMNKQDQTVHETAAINLVKTIVELLMYTKHSINFALYFWPGSQFRKQFCQTFCLKGQNEEFRGRSQTVTEHLLLENPRTKSVETKC